VKRYVFIIELIIILFSASLGLRAVPADSVKADSPKFGLFKTAGHATLLFNQITFKNWAQGGENSISTTGLVNYPANLENDNFSWDNNLDLKFGIQATEEYGLRTNQDVIDISSKAGYKALSQFYYTGLISFKSQFGHGYNYPNDSVIVSKFFAPAYLILSLGMDFKPNDHLSLYLSPMTGKFIFVSDQQIANTGTYTGVPAKLDTNGNVIENGRNLKSDFGAYLRLSLKYNIMQNTELTSKLEIFNNFTDQNLSNRSNFDVDWEAVVMMKVNEFMSANLALHLIYDNDTKSPLYSYINGVKTQIGAGPRLQIKEVMGIGVSYYFK
jgi:hypothetical protein